MEDRDLNVRFIDLGSSFSFTFLPFLSSSYSYMWFEVTKNCVLILSQNHFRIDEPPSERRLPDRRASADTRRRGSVAVTASRARSLTEQEMRITLDVPSYNLPGGRRGSGNHLMVPDDESPYVIQPQTKSEFEQCRATSPTSATFLQMHSGVRRHRSLPSPGFINAIPLAAKNQTRSSSFRQTVSCFITFSCSYFMHSMKFPIKRRAVHEDRGGKEYQR